MLRSYEEELKKSREVERAKNKYQDREYLPRGTPGQRKTIDATSTTKPTKARETERVNRESGAPESRDRGDDSYLTFPGQSQGYPPYGPSPYSYPADPRYSQPPGWGMGGGMPPYYPTYYPPHYGSYYPRRPPDAFGVTALTFGIVAMCIFWLSIIPDFIGLMFFIVLVCITGMGIIFGGYSFGNRMRRSIHGLVGMILSILAIILSTIIFYRTHIYVEYYDLIITFITEII